MKTDKFRTNINEIKCILREHNIDDSICMGCTLEWFRNRIKQIYNLGEEFEVSGEGLNA